MFIIMTMVSSCIESKTTVSIKKYLTDNFNDDDDGVIGGTPVYSLLSALSSPFSPSAAGFCFQKNSTQNFCWGDALPMAVDFSALPVAEAPLYGKTIEKYDASYSTSCVVANGKAYCWGIGAIGNSPTRISTIPVAVDTAGVLSGKTIKDVSTSVHRACAVDTGNDIYCWGSGTFGGLGNASNADSDVPVAVSKAGVLNGLTIKSVTSGYYHTCVIASDDKVYCWGSGGNGQLGNGASFPRNTPVAAVIPGGLTVKAMTSTLNTNCVIASDDQVYCWGLGDVGQIGDGLVSNTNSPTLVDTTGALSGKTIKSITSSNRSICAIASDDQVYCWGYLGKLVNGVDSYAYVPTAVDTSGVLNGLTIKKVSIGTGTFCAIASDDKVYCWGDGADGKLGNNSTAHSPTPVAVYTSGVLSGKVIVEVKLYGTVVCVRDSSNELYCWGKNDNGQLGNNSKTNSSIPVAVIKKDVVVGKTFKNILGNFSSNLICAIGSDDQLYCWGLNTASGLPTYSAQLYPMPVYANSISNTTLSNITFQTSSYDGLVCVQTANGDFYCKSDEFIKRFNFGVQFKASHNFLGGSSTCYLGVDNLAYCTGDVLGTASVVSSNVPVALDMTNVGVGETIKDMQIGNLHGCILATNNKVYCWGQNIVGLLGTGNLLDAVIPTEIDMSGALSGKTIKALSVGPYSSCVIASDDKAYCWGYNPTGAIGNGTITDAVSPVAVDTTGVLNGKRIRNLTLGPNGTCAIADDNLAYCWGANTTGALGNGTLIDSYVPVAVDTTGVLNGITMKGLLLAEYFTCGIGSDDQVYCWGLNDIGQLGNGNNTDSSVPVAVSRSGVLNNKTVKNLKIVESTSCVLASDDKAYCWGKGSSNNLGNNTGVDSNIPVEVLYAP